MSSPANPEGSAADHPAPRPAPPGADPSGPGEPGVPYAPPGATGTEVAHPAGAAEATGPGTHRPPAPASARNGSADDGRGPENSRGPGKGRGDNTGRGRDKGRGRDQNGDGGPGEDVEADAPGGGSLLGSGRDGGGLGGADFGPLHFQLVLLRRMADHQGERVAEALRELGVGRGELREANRRWQMMVRSPRQRGALRRYHAVLGPPAASTKRRVGDLTCEALSWTVPLWPTLRFEVLAGPGGAVWNEWLVRAPDAAGPVLRSAADLVPWSCTVDEVARAFAPARPMEGSAPTRWQLAFTAPAEPPAEGAAAARTDYVAEFTWGLLQRVWEAE